MQSSPSKPYWPEEQRSVLQQLLNCKELQILGNQGGGNSKVFCAEADGKKWAVKSYPPYAPNQRDRLLAECQTYEFLNQQHIPAVPSLKAISISERWLIIDWIDGAIPTEYTTIDINQAIQFLTNIAALNNTPAAAELPLAAEACLSLDVLLQQIKQRTERLLAQPEPDTTLIEFLTNDFQPIATQCQQQAIKGYQSNQLSTSDELPQQHRSLIPADFGFHNSLRDAKGNLHFFDFDYFGWDDPVKLLADILWHPKMQLSTGQQKQFVQGITTIYQKDSLFTTRFKYTQPLFGLRWVLILLNEFIPAFWQNRQHAATQQSHEMAKAVQLKRAKEWLNRVTVSLFL